MDDTPGSITERQAAYIERTIPTYENAHRDAGMSLPIISHDWADMSCWEASLFIWGMASRIRELTDSDRNGSGPRAGYPDSATQSENRP